MLIQQSGDTMLDKNRTILIVTDIQEKLAKVMHEREELIRQVGILIDSIRILQVPILWVEQYPKGLGPTVPDVASHLDNLEPLSKISFSSMRAPAIEHRFKDMGRDQVLIAGIEAHVCIYQTAIDLLSRDYDVQVVEDAVSSRTLANKRIGLQKVHDAGGGITSVETALFELLCVAEGAAFKRISALLK